MIPEKVLSKYAKVQELEKRGVGGERDAAAAIAKELRAKYPGIETAAQQAKPQENDKYWWPGQPGGPQTGGNWERIFAYAQGVWGAASSFAETVTEAARGAALAEEVKTTSRVSRAGNLLIGFSMPIELYHKVARLSPVQQVAFRHRLHDALSEELDLLLGGE
jgi:hypothetical protein|tara:strand:+ start:1420 stop:1908 length:489 start_codon:yes stop_codon:yes gene_type:complete